MVAQLARIARPTLRLIPAPTDWSLENLSGRLVELSGTATSPLLTLGFALVHEAQRQGEPAVWISSSETTFFPPDVAAGGIDLSALPVIRARDARQMARAADHLVRSGAFALLVLDLGRGDLSLPMQTRLSGLAQKHETAILCLTDKPRSRPSLGSLISLRGQAHRRPAEGHRFHCEVIVLKDKRSGPGWTHTEVCRGPEGLR